jgi:hypothetical protein
MARTRWPPDCEPWPLIQTRQTRDGTTGGCPKTWDPADRSFRKTTSGVSRSAGQAGTQATDPTPAPGQTRRSRAGSTHPHPPCRLFPYLADGKAARFIGSYPPVRPVGSAGQMRIRLRRRHRPVARSAFPASPCVAVQFLRTAASARSATSRSCSMPGPRSSRVNKPTAKSAQPRQCWLGRPPVLVSSGGRREFYRGACGLACAQWP